MKQYYNLTICNKIFTSISDGNLRVWKIVDYDGRMHQSRLAISNPSDLYKFIKGTNPKALYVSVSKFINPSGNHGAFYKQNFRLIDGTNMFPRKGYIVGDNILIDTILFIDLDSPDSLTIAQKDGQKIIRYMDKKKDYKLNLLQFSATQGIHIGYEFLNKPKIANPLMRIEYYKKKKEEIVKELLQLDLKTIDKTHIEIIKNNFGVFAAPFSIKENNNIVTPLDKDKFMNKNIYIMLRSLGFNLTRNFKKRRHLTSEAFKANDEKRSCAKDTSLATRPYGTGGRLTGLSSQFIFKFIDSMVNGLTNTYVTVIKKHIKRFKIKDLKNLQKEKNLSNFLIYKIGNFIYVYNFKIQDFEGEIKILRKAKSENISFFYTRRHLPIQISNSVYQDGKLANKIEYVGNLKSVYGLEHNHSKPHCDLFGLNFKNMVGKENRVGTMRCRGQVL